MKALATRLVLVFALVALCGSARTLSAQHYGDPLVLLGVDSVVAFAELTWDDRIESGTRSQAQIQMLEALQLGLMRMGLVVLSADDTNPGELPLVVCSVVTLRDSDGLVSASQMVTFEEPMIDPDSWESFYARRWGQATVRTVGESKLEASDWGSDCAQDFELAWRRANQGG